MNRPNERHNEFSKFAFACTVCVLFYTTCQFRHLSAQSTNLVMQCDCTAHRTNRTIQIHTFCIQIKLQIEDVCWLLVPPFQYKLQWRSIDTNDNNDHCELTMAVNYPLTLIHGEFTSRLCVFFLFFFFSSFISLWLRLWQFEWQLRWIFRDLRMISNEHKNYIWFLLSFNAKTEFVHRMATQPIISDSIIV